MTIPAMKLIQANPALKNLNDHIEKNMARLEYDPKKRNQRKAAGVGFKDNLTNEQQQFQEKRAATVIQRFWRKKTVKQSFTRSPYFTYLSLIDPNDEQRLLSSIMFGRHVAEFQTGSRYRVKNPFIHKNAYYHRDDNLSGFLIDGLMSEFHIPLNKKEQYLFIPVTLLKNTPVEELFKQFFPKKTMLFESNIIKDDQHTVGFITLPKNHHNCKYIINVLRAFGVIASPWEIAININKKGNFNIPRPIKLYKHLPDSSEALLKSRIIYKLSRLARNNRYPTQKLATSLLEILKNLPDHLKPDAIQRIACMVDMANTFYETDYPRFAFAVYTIIHEISLSLLKQQNPDDLAKGFHEFLNESKRTFYGSTGLDSGKQDKTAFIACPAMSGTNAYALAMKLALNMQTASGKTPSVKVVKPAYYEFNYLTKTTSRSNADIFVLTAGPIVNPEGLTPGVDINRFVQRNIIAKKRKKPAVLVIDATTALYKNLKLAPEVQALVNEEKLSIIIHESHQKFGMIHSDQAQYGRMFALCSKEHFDQDVIHDMQAGAWEDYSTHLDLRVGAYISSTCGDTLEAIKQQHFTNGALLRNILTRVSLASRKIITHQDMLANPDELYFVTSTHDKFRETLKNIIENRDSFGHFGTVGTTVDYQFRLSPGASDDLDCFIQAAQIYLANHFKPQDALKLLLQHTSNDGSLSLSEQIITIALANNASALLSSSTPDALPRLFTLQTLLGQCDSLKGRTCHTHLAEIYYELKQQIIADYKINNPKDFFAMTKILYEKNLTLTEQQVKRLAENNFIRNFLMKHHRELSTAALSAILDLSGEVLNEKQIRMMLDNKPFSGSVIKIHQTIGDVLSCLQDAPGKHEKAMTCSKQYYKTCLDALQTFHDAALKNKSAQKTLIASLNCAQDHFCKHVLGEDRSAFSKTVRYLMKGVVNFIAALTFGIAHYMNYKTTGQTLFLSGTASENKLKRFHRTFQEELEDTNATDSPIPISVPGR
ncbi:hypothetical protein [Legionella spiritensis]|uniref:Uncharacterized protein n=1 Tax=Legionella spiritensis TaxID=452 RepID=A0A0W0YXG6_LEGSP|nr:hypothetical protein [Legionella spiritensis]KTD61559.1 hypothetical protein Lspi_2189 [Legionella spiritensis]SNV32487.1 Uncharacterised protein [Legionella spiritensis]